MIKPKIFKNQPLKYATSTKIDGHTSFNHIDQTQTENNINQFIDRLNWNIKSRAFMRITYGKTRTYDVITEVKSANNSNKVKFDEALITDALITDVKGVALMLPTADCYPVTIFDPEKRVLALVHLGWHSSSANLLTKLVSTFSSDYDSKPSDILVYFGPGIPARYYKFQNPSQLKMSNWTNYLHKTSDNYYEIDLLSYNLDQIEKDGITSPHIEVDTRNTAEDDTLESHFIHNQSGLPTARRFLTVVMIDS